MKSLILSVLLAPCLMLQAEPRHALIMGVWDYSDASFAPLPERGIKADLNRMQETLSALGFVVTTVENPSLKAAKLAVDEFGTAIKKTPGTALFYFTGHGSEFEGRNFLIPTGSAVISNRDLDTEALAADRVLSRMEESGGKVSIVFLDCCRNSLAKGASGLATMDARGTFIGFATSSQKVSSATQEGSLYTRVLAKHLASPGISILDMHTLVTQEVSRIDHSQVPHQYSGLDELFYFAKSASVNVAPQAPLPQVMPAPKPEPRTATSRALVVDAFKTNSLHGTLRGGLQHQRGGEIALTLEITNNRKDQYSVFAGLIETPESVQRRSTALYVTPNVKPVPEPQAVLVASTGERYRCTALTGLRVCSSTFDPLVQLSSDRPTVVTLRFTPLDKTSQVQPGETVFSLDLNFLVRLGSSPPFPDFGPVPVSISDLK